MAIRYIKYTFGGILMLAIGLSIEYRLLGDKLTNLGAYSLGMFTLQVAFILIFFLLGVMLAAQTDEDISDSL